jgi:hypothetical protein
MIVMPPDRCRHLAASARQLAVIHPAPHDDKASAGDTKFLAQFFDVSFTLPHRRQRHPQLGHGQLVGTAVLAATGPGHALDAFSLQLVFKLGQRREYAQGHLAVRGHGVDYGALRGQYLEAEAPCGQIVYHADQVAQVRPRRPSKPMTSSSARRHLTGLFDLVLLGLDFLASRISAR